MGGHHLVTGDSGPRRRFNRVSAIMDGSMMMVLTTKSQLCRRDHGQGRNELEDDDEQDLARTNASSGMESRWDDRNRLPNVGWDRVNPRGQLEQEIRAAFGSGGRYGGIYSQVSWLGRCGEWTNPTHG